MSAYASLRPLLRAYCASGALDEAARARLLTIPVAEDAAQRPPGHPAWDQARDEIGLARGLLLAVADGRLGDALALAEALRDAPLRPSPFETLLEDAALKLATTTGDGDLLLALVSRRDAYWQRYAAGAALSGALELLTDPEMAAVLAEALEPDDAEGPDVGVPADPLPTVATAPPAAARPRTRIPQPLSSAFAPFAAEDEQETNAYVVTLRHLQQAKTATFAVHRVHWHDLESDDRRVSDLVLAFEDDAAGMLKTVDPELLSLRLFFGDGPAYDELSTADGSLYDVEVNPAEGRIYLKLRRPAAWLATDLPAAELWRHLRSCVLITEPA